MKDPKEIEQAWIGDAVLGLYARKWILFNEKKMDAKMFSRMTSNHFLNSLGNPTKVEAKIGRIYRKEGLEKAIISRENLFPFSLDRRKKESVEPEEGSK